MGTTDRGKGCVKSHLDTGPSGHGAVDYQQLTALDGL